MAKTKTPFFSLGSQGTVGGSLTSQKRGSATLLREKPVPTDPYSLPQAYQRWLYEDYAYLWTLQSEATRRSYAATGSRYHLTGFQYWMKYQLTNLPDIAGYWKLDAATGVLTHDSSRNLNHGTIIGASPATGLIDGCLYFDGINDLVNFGSSSTLALTDNFTLDLFIRPTTLTAAHDRLLVKGIADAAGYCVTLFGNDLELGRCASVNFNDSINKITNANLIQAAIWYHILAVYSAGWTLFIDGAPVALINSSLLGYGAGADLLLGARSDGIWYNGREDHLIIYNRALDATEALRHSARRYPV